MTTTAYIELQFHIDFFVYLFIPFYSKKKDFELPIMESKLKLVTYDYGCGMWQFLRWFLKHTEKWREMWVFMSATAKKCGHERQRERIFYVFISFRQMFLTLWQNSLLTILNN